MTDSNPREYTGDDITSLNNKLIAFATGLTPGEMNAFSNLVSSAQQGLGGEVAGYDADGLNHELVTGIDWESLVNPAGLTPRIIDGPALDRNV